MTQGDCLEAYCGFKFRKKHCFNLDVNASNVNQNVLLRPRKEFHVIQARPVNKAYANSP